MPVLNITRHKATQGQLDDGVIDLPDYIIDPINQLGIFEPVPSVELLRERAEQIVDILQIHYPMYDDVMCGGAPYFNSILDKALISRGFKPHYPFTYREYVTHTDSKGKTVNTPIYVHRGLVPTS